jgi:signal transduction histidine kinase
VIGIKPNDRPSLWRSAGLRLALVYGLLFALSTLALVMFLWWATAGLLDRQMEAAIRADAQGLTEQWQIGGLEALQTTIEDRLAENVDDDAIYLLTDSDMHPLAGNLTGWPSAVVLPETPYDLMVSRAGFAGMARVQRFNLPDGSLLLIGRDVESRTPMRALLASALLWSLALLAVLGLVGALVMQRLFRRMIASISVTAVAIAQGDLGRRVRVTGRRDEFDRLAETINDMLDRIGRLMDGVREVSNSIAHDLRTPIARARARLEDAAEHASGPQELRAALDRAITDLDGVTAVFDALLRIAEIEAGTRRSAFADFDLAPVFAELCELYTAPAEERGLTLRCDTPDSLPVHGDRDLIGQAVVNLLDNALKFSPAGGVVQLKATYSPDAVSLIVQDSGPGIPVCDRGRAAERFFRGELARHTPGSGLGLALVEAVAQLHGGTLALEDAEPGLRAVLTVPAHPPSLASP